MTTDARVQQIQDRLLPLQEALLQHPVYAAIDRLDKLQVFMQHHVFAVYDFMSLLKTLQQKLCSSRVPWLPPADPDVARLVNEIVLGEETDEDGAGGYCSHYDLYHRAMRGCGASTAAVDSFVESLRSGQPLEEALTTPGIPSSVQKFVQHTFKVIDGGNICAVASAFTFGREDLLPDVFQRVVDELNVETSGGLEDFRFYLSRHIELDGDHHGPMAQQMIVSLCGDDEENWQVASNAAVAALESRQVLWDGMHDAMQATG